MTKDDLLQSIADFPGDAEVSVVLQGDDADEGDVLIITDAGFGGAGYVIYVSPIGIAEDGNDDE